MFSCPVVYSNFRALNCTASSKLMDVTVKRTYYEMLNDKLRDRLYIRGRQPFLHCGPVWKWNFFADRLSKTTNVQQWIFITNHASYYNFDSMRTLSLFCRNETLPHRSYGTQWHPQCVHHVQSVSRFRLRCCHHRKCKLAWVGCRKQQQSLWFYGKVRIFRQDLRPTHW